MPVTEFEKLKNLFLELYLKLKPENILKPQFDALLNIFEMESIVKMIYIYFYQYKIKNKTFDQNFSIDCNYAVEKTLKDYKKFCKDNNIEPVKYRNMKKDFNISLNRNITTFENLKLKIKDLNLSQNKYYSLCYKILKRYQKKDKIEDGIYITKSAE